MTPILKPILANLRTTNFTLSLCLGDLKEEDARRRIRGSEGPSIAWEVGHLLDHRCKILNLLGVAKESPYTAQYTLAGATDGRDYPDTPEFQKQWNQLSSELESALETASPEVLERIAGRGPHGEKTVLDAILFLVWHDAYHMGAVASIRKELGYPGPAELVLARAAA